MPQRGLVRRNLGALFGWLVDRAVDRWPEVLAVFVGGGGMTYLAYITDWINAYGPVAWGGVGLLTILLLSFAFFLFAQARASAAIATYTKKKSEASTTNVLAPVHEHERINLIDFYHPFFRAIEGARFEDCELMGPAAIGIDGCNFLHGGMHDCEIVIVRPDRGIVGATMFRHCTFLRCHFYRITLFVNHQQYQNFPEDMRQRVRVISDGRVGDI